MRAAGLRDADWCAYFVPLAVYHGVRAAGLRDDASSDSALHEGSNPFGVIGIPPVRLTKPADLAVGQTHIGPIRFGLLLITIMMIPLQPNHPDRALARVMAAPNSASWVRLAMAAAGRAALVVPPAAWLALWGLPSEAYGLPSSTTRISRPSGKEGGGKE